MCRSYILWDFPWDFPHPVLKKRSHSPRKNGLGRGTHEAFAAASAPASLQSMLAYLDAEDAQGAYRGDPVFLGETPLLIYPLVMTNIANLLGLNGILWWFYGGFMVVLCWFYGGLMGFNMI